MGNEIKNGRLSSQDVANSWTPAPCLNEAQAAIELAVAMGGARRFKLISFVAFLLGLDEI